MTAYRAKPTRGCTLNRTHRLGRGLVAAYLFNGAGGLTLRDAAGKSDGTLTNFAQTAWTGGAFGKTLTFDGTDDYVNVPNNTTLAITGPITLAAWFRRVAASAGQYQAILSRWGGSNSYALLYDDTSNLLRVSLQGLTTATVTRSVSIEDGNWHHAAATYDGANIRLYLDGVQLGADTASTGTITDNAQALRIGRDNTGFGTAYWNGQLDAVMIWNRGLNGSEARALYADSFAMFRRRTEWLAMGPIRSGVFETGDWPVFEAPKRTLVFDAPPDRGEA